MAFVSVSTSYQKFELFSFFCLTNLGRSREKTFDRHFWNSCVDIRHINIFNKNYDILNIKLMFRIVSFVFLGVCILFDLLIHSFKVGNQNFVKRHIFNARLNSISYLLLISLWRSTLSMLLKSNWKQNGYRFDKCTYRHIVMYRIIFSASIDTYNNECTAKTLMRLSGIMRLPFAHNTMAKLRALSRKRMHDFEQFNILRLVYEFDSNYSQNQIRKAADWEREREWSGRTAERYVSFPLM